MPTGNLPTQSPPLAGRVDFALLLSDKQEQHDLELEVLSQRLDAVKEACANRVLKVQTKCHARSALHALRANAAEADVRRRHAKLRKALQDKPAPPSVQWYEREEELEQQLLLAAERRQRAAVIFANKSQRLIAHNLMLRCFLALRLLTATKRQHAATGSFTRRFHVQRTRKLAFHAWRLATLASRKQRQESKELSSVVAERLACAEEVRPRAPALLLLHLFLLLLLLHHHLLRLVHRHLRLRLLLRRVLTLLHCRRSTTRRSSTAPSASWPTWPRPRSSAPSSRRAGRCSAEWRLPAGSSASGARGAGCCASSSSAAAGGTLRLPSSTTAPHRPAWCLQPLGPPHSHAA